MEDSGIPRVFPRMTPHQRTLHLLSIALFLSSAISGISLQLYDGAHAARLVGLAGGFESMVRLHLVVALAFVALMVYHLASLIFLAVKGDWTLRNLTLLPGRQDLRELVDDVRFLLFLETERPAFGEFSYIQKFDYFAAMVGIAFMIASGLAVGSPEYTVMLVPATYFGGLRAVHMSVGFALIFIFLVWHVCNNLLAPGNLFSNWSWINGRMSENMMKREHGGYYDDLMRREREEALTRAKGAEAESAEKIIRKESRRLQEHLEAGNLYAKEEDHAKAIEEYKKSLELLPNFPQARYNLAVVYQKSGDIRQAIVEYEKFLEMDPFNVVAEKVRTLLREMEKSKNGGSDGGHQPR